MKLVTQATVHYCDGCSTSFVQVDGDDLPSGFYVDVMEVHGFGAENGRLYVCAQKCLLPAFKRRREVWDA
jgi:hypothetical protein